MNDDEEIRAQQACFVFEAEDAKRHFGEWDMCDPVCWALLRVVQAQNDLAHAYVQHECFGVSEIVIERAVAERLAAIDELLRAIEENPSPP
jgi:hypothetical protein